MKCLRKAKPEDADGIARLYRELTTKSPINVLPERITEISEDPNTYLIVCEENGAILATALLTLCNDVMFKRQPFAVIENVVVSKDSQRKGIGKNLMKNIEEFCLKQDCSKIMLLSGIDNRSAHNFYAAVGYNTDAKAGFIKYRTHFGS